MCPEASRPRILLVEDERLFAATLGLGLEAAGYAVTIAASAEDALALLPERSFDLAILDEWLPGRSGLGLATILREEFHLAFIFLTACDTGAQRAIGEGALAYLVKPVDVAQLLPMVATALARSVERARLQETRDQLQSAVDQQRDVSVATGLIMARMDMDLPESFELLRRAARASRRPLADVARELIANRGTVLKIKALMS
jgi:response regulator NasT